MLQGAGSAAAGRDRHRVFGNAAGRAVRTQCTLYGGGGRTIVGDDNIHIIELQTSAFNDGIGQVDVVPYACAGSLRGAGTFFHYKQGGRYAGIIHVLGLIHVCREGYFLVGCQSKENLLGVGLHQGSRAHRPNLVLFRCDGVGPLFCAAEERSLDGYGSINSG